MERKLTMEQVRAANDKLTRIQAERRKRAHQSGIMATAETLFRTLSLTPADAVSAAMSISCAMAIETQAPRDRFLEDVAKCWDFQKARIDLQAELAAKQAGLPDGAKLVAVEPAADTVAALEKADPLLTAEPEDPLARTAEELKAAPIEVRKGYDEPSDAARVADSETPAYPPAAEVGQ